MDKPMFYCFPLCLFLPIPCGSDLGMRRALSALASLYLGFQQQVFGHRCQEFIEQTRSLSASGV
jgi:hypothetical protein